ncbi:MAG: hypothetical protein JWM02_884 [Frankiales bacterium]|nr:hypothetical protein [Frankiales bacterium]
MTTDFWAAPAAHAETSKEPTPSRWREDLVAFVGIVVSSVLLGAPAGLLWSRLAPRLTVQVTDQGPNVSNLESTKAFVGADGSYLVVMLIVGLLCGALAWRFARRSGPWTVLALAIGGVLAALIAASVGLRPGAQHAMAAVREGSSFRGSVELFLGKNTGNSLSLRAPWAAVGWPVGALSAFLIGALRRPEELD